MAERNVTASVMQPATTSFSRTDIETTIIELLKDMVQDWDLDFQEEIGPNSRIIEDLEFESIDLVQLMVAVEQSFAIKGLPYEKVFMENGAYVTEIQVSELVDFLAENLKNSN